MRAARGPEICHYRSRVSDQLVTGDNPREGAEEEFVREAEGECVVEDFPMPGETVTLEWQQSSQNFVIIGNE